MTTHYQVAIWGRVGESQLSEFFLFGDGGALYELTLDGFFLFFEGCALDGAAHHVGFALEACALCRGIQDACGIVGGHALEGIRFLSVSRGHFCIPSFITAIKYFNDRISKSGQLFFVTELMFL